MKWWARGLILAALVVAACGPGRREFGNEMASGGAGGDGGEAAGANSGSGASGDGGEAGADPGSKCDVDPCLNGGLCYTSDGVAACKCSAAFQGPNCESSVDDCATKPCLNQGTCVDLDNGYACTCPSGFSGLDCERVVSGCSDDPCLNGGHCADAGSSYTCSCTPGYGGSNCELNIDDCANTPCKNAGLCKDGVNGYSCECKDGFTGQSCETNVDDCGAKPCQNGGTCKDGTNAYSCTCAAGFSGTNCETNIDECAASPCKNGGTCKDGTNSHTCTCAAGFSGANCETNINDCTGSPCKNGGTCVDGVNTHSCTCTSQYTGNACEYLEVKLVPTTFTTDESTATALSNDGSVMVFNVTRPGGATSLGRLVDFASAVSVNVSTVSYDSIAGRGIDGNGATIVGVIEGTPFKTVGNGGMLLNLSPFITDSEPGGIALDVSTDGSAIVGYAYGAGTYYGFYCKGGSCREAGALGPHEITITASSVSADGSVVAGYGSPVDPVWPGRAWRWTPSNGVLTELQLLATTWLVPQANSISGDGKVIVGSVLINNVQHAIRWSGTTPTDLGLGVALGTNSDGSVIVGADNSGAAIVWNGTTRSTLASILGSNSDLTGATLIQAAAVSDNGKVVAATAMVGGKKRALMARLP